MDLAWELEASELLIILALEVNHPKLKLIHLVHLQTFLSMVQDHVLNLSKKMDSKFLAKNQSSQPKTKRARESSLNSLIWQIPKLRIELMRSQGMIFHTTQPCLLNKNQQLKHQLSNNSNNNLLLLTPSPK